MIIINAKPTKAEKAGIIYLLAMLGFGIELATIFPKTWPLNVAHEFNASIYDFPLKPAHTGNS